MGKNFSAKPLAGELREKFYPRKSFQPNGFSSLFGKIKPTLPVNALYYINNKRDNNIIKSNFQPLFRLKNREGVV